MPVQINELSLQVDDDGAPAAGQTPPAPLPLAAEAWRAQWLAARLAEQQARWAATDRDDER
ncbi:hypothetical protein [Rubrivivax rivuli]|uniref:Uncharacterized protein n=1 Tax=Rubrivivax rivuli TaxID=1862385 RepID=A0A437RHG0_9BURK|nr:hypothetical protein [Rubrivivax rivuli]RVU46217.1 hypothetical protein EOE66_10190 [Rubrivivax rivuli]